MHVGIYACKSPGYKRFIDILLCVGRRHHGDPIWLIWDDNSAHGHCNIFFIWYWWIWADIDCKVRIRIRAVEQGSPIQNPELRYRRAASELIGWSKEQRRWTITTTKIRTAKEKREKKPWELGRSHEESKTNILTFHWFEAKLFFYFIQRKTPHRIAF